MMRIVIDIPKDVYKRTVFYREFRDLSDCVATIKALENGTPLEEIRTEIETKYGQCDICEYFENYDYEENDISEYIPIGNIADILQIIDGHKSESEEK